MSKTYRYVGPPEILARNRSAPKGMHIRCADELRAWIKATGQRPDSQIVTTFAIDANGSLLIADRRSEHVACAGGETVLSAGEVDYLAHEQVLLRSQGTNVLPPKLRCPARMGPHFFGLSFQGRGPPHSANSSCSTLSSARTQSFSE